MTKKVQEVQEKVQEEETPIALSIQDLAALRNIIDLASQRGAFKAEEFAAIGAVFNKLHNFINVIMPQIEQAKAAEEAKAAEANKDVVVPEEK